MRGIILAGGSGTRLHPATLAINKQLLPIYDKPMIYYPLSVLMLAGIREIMIISSPDYLDNYRRLFGDGSELGLRIDYGLQARPEGLPQAFAIAADFLDGGPAALILGDNIFYGSGFGTMLQRIAARPRGATILAYRVKDPQAYGVVELGPDGQVLTLEEKPQAPRSDLAVTGLYFFDHQVVGRAAQLVPSPRGELEITDLIRLYLEAGELSVEQIGRGFAWLDTGTHDSLVEASEFVRVIQKRTGRQIACLEEIAFQQGFISREQLRARGLLFARTGYGQALLELAGEQDGEQVPKAP